ncbi:unnamed protein product [Cunninghamella echinulata]
MEKNRNITLKYKIRSIPIVIDFNNRKEIDKNIGIPSDSRLVVLFQGIDDSK